MRYWLVGIRSARARCLRTKIRVVLIRLGAVATRVEDFVVRTVPSKDALNLTVRRFLLLLLTIGDQLHDWD